MKTQPDTVPANRQSPVRNPRGITALFLFLVSISSIHAQTVELKTIYGNPSSGIRMKANGVSGSNVILEVSEDLNCWTGIDFGTLGTGGCVLVDNRARLPASSFYDAVLVDDVLAGGKKFTSSLPQLVTVTYPTMDGDTLVLSNAFSGWLEVFTSNSVSSEVVESFVGARGGVVLASMPGAGIYLVEVPSGMEPALLSNLYEQTWMEEGGPASPCGPMSLLNLDQENANGVDPCGRHMPAVKAVLSRRSKHVVTLDYAKFATNCADEIAGNFAIAEEVLKAVKSNSARGGPPLVINIPLGTFVGPDFPQTDLTDCSEGYCRLIRHRQTMFLLAIMKVLDKLQAHDPLAAGKVLVVVSAGNYGLDFDQQFETLARLHPGVFRMLKIVGGTTINGSIDRTLGHLKSSDCQEWYMRERVTSG